MNKPTVEALAMTNEHVANQEANAVLMAAAPEMYHLIRAWRFSDPHGEYSDACREIIEKIEKAESRE